MHAFVDPLTLARINNLPLVAKRVAEGFLFGLHQSVQRGSGIEFSQYRAYERGDAPARIDWKLFARNDRYFVREAERESDVQVWFLIDYSRSMMMRSHFTKADHSPNTEGTRGAWHKLDYARHMAASMAYLAQNQGDSIGFIGLSDHNVQFLRAGAGTKHWYTFLRAMKDTGQGKAFAKPEQVAKLFTHVHKPSLIFVISDFYEHAGEITDMVRRLSSARSEVLAMQLLCRDELAANYHGTLRVQDLESGEELLLNGDEVGQQLKQNLKAHQQRLAATLARHRTELCTIDIDQALDHALYHFLKQRRRVGHCA